MAIQLKYLNERELKGKNKAFVYEGTYVYES